MKRILDFWAGEAFYREFVTQGALADPREDFNLLCPASSAIDERSIELDRSIRQGVHILLMCIRTLQSKIGPPDMGIGGDGGRGAFAEHAAFGDDIGVVAEGEGKLGVLLDQ